LQALLKQQPHGAGKVRQVGPQVPHTWHAGLTNAAHMRQLLRFASVDCGAPIGTTQCGHHAVHPPAVGSVCAKEVTRADHQHTATVGLRSGLPMLFQRLAHAPFVRQRRRSSSGLSLWRAAGQQAVHVARQHHGHVSVGHGVDHGFGHGQHGALPIHVAAGAGGVDDDVAIAGCVAQSLRLQGVHLAPRQLCKFRVSREMRRFRTASGQGHAQALPQQLAGDGRACSARGADHQGMVHMREAGGRWCVSDCHVQIS